MVCKVGFQTIMLTYLLDRLALMAKTVVRKIKYFVFGTSLGLELATF
jgi:hypothetical protein